MKLLLLLSLTTVSLVSADNHESFDVSLSEPDDDFTMEKRMKKSSNSEETSERTLSSSSSEDTLNSTSLEENQNSTEVEDGKHTVLKLDLPDDVDMESNPLFKFKVNVNLRPKKPKGCLRYCSVVTYNNGYPLLTFVCCSNHIYFPDYQTTTKPPKPVCPPKRKKCPKKINPNRRSCKKNADCARKRKCCYDNCFNKKVCKRTVLR